MFSRKIKSFLCELLKLAIKKPSAVNVFDLIKYFPDWWSSLSPQRNSLADNKPWIAFAAIKFLENILHKEMVVYEYGSGGSTIFFAKRVKKVVSTEHDRNWYEKVIDEIYERNITNCTVRLFEPNRNDFIYNATIADPNGYISDDEKYRGMSFENYASSIDEFPDYFFDVIIIDGRARPSCFKHSQKKLKNNGIMILDNAETPYYDYIHKTMNDMKWNKINFYGLFPYTYHFSETCIWQKV